MRINIQNPTMYSTVINNHSTVITHPILAPIVASLPTSATQQLANGMMSNEAPQEELAKLSPGAYSIPVKIQGGTINDPTLSGYESPNFIHKNEKILPTANGAIIPDLSVNVSNVASDDLKEFTTQLGNAHNKQEKLVTCIIMTNIYLMISRKRKKEVGKRSRRTQINCTKRNRKYIGS